MTEPNKGQGTSSLLLARHPVRSTNTQPWAGRLAERAAQLPEWLSPSPWHDHAAVPSSVTSGMAPATENLLTDLHSVRQDSGQTTASPSWVAELYQGQLGRLA